MTQISFLELVQAMLAAKNLSKFNEYSVWLLETQE